MQRNDLEATARTDRVQELCWQLTQLVSLSKDQRRALDRILAELERLFEVERGQSPSAPQLVRRRAAGSQE